SLTPNSVEAENCVGWQIETSGEAVALARNVEIYQDSSGGENWHSPVHVNRSGRVPCQFRGYRVTYENQQSAGLRANPVVGLCGSKIVVAAAVEDFWQQFPISMKASS